MKSICPPIIFRLFPLLALVGLLPLPAQAQRQMEKLGRGVVVLHSATSQAYVGWRLLATDPTEVSFNLYRATSGGAGVKLNSLPLTNTTDFLDTTATFTVSNAWYVVAITNGVEATPGAAYGLAANSPVRQYLPIPLVAPGAFIPYDVKFCWVGDFDGDGEYDFLVDRLSTTSGKNQFLQAYKRDGTFLWQMDMGFLSTNTSNTYEPDAAAISVGDKDNVTVYDLDGDGRAEVIVRAANGSILPDGTPITTNNNTSQFLCILDGLTGKEKARALIPNPYFADGPLNCHAGIAYFDGIHPSILFSGENRVGSGAFQRLAVAWDFRDGKLTQRWLFQTPSGQNDSEGHQLRIADVNHDGKDEIVRIGSVVADSNGVPVVLYSTECAHGDRYHVTDIDPDRPGLEMYSIQQLNSTLLATELQDLGSGKLYKKWYSGGITDVGRGIAADIAPNSRGCEVYSTQPGIFDAKGNQIYANNVWAPEGIWWDADLGREFEDGAGSGALSPVINKFDPVSGTSGRMYSLYGEDGGCHQAYGGRAAFWGDILGDWREEFIVVANDYNSLRIYTTKLPATNRLYCLMQNPQYRVQCTYKGYYQASYVDYFLGYQMPPPPPPAVSDARLVWRGNGTNVWDSAAGNWFTNNLWISNTTATTYHSGDTVLFDATGTNTTVALNGTLTPGWIKVHSPDNYTFDGSHGSLAGAMKLTKAGAGKLFFNGTNTYTGATLVGEGALIVNGALPNSPVTVRGGVWLDGRLGGSGVVSAAVSLNEGAGVSPGQGTNSPGTLTIANNVTLTGRTLNDFDLSDDATGTTKTNDLLAITGNLTVTGTNTFVIRKLNATLPPGVYPLINYSGTFSGGLSNFTVSGLTGIPFALTNPPGQIALLLKNYRLPANLTWTGGQGGNAWDLLTSSNWLNGVAKDQFAPNDTVRFDNTGATNPTVTLSGDLVCSNLVVDATNNYILTGGGGIIGPAGLTKTNSGTLTISAINNSFTGKTILAGGTLVVAELDAVGFPSPLGNPPGGSTNLVLSGSPTLRVTGESYTDRGLTLNAGTNSIDVTNSTAQLTIAGVIAGSGALQKAGAGTLAVSANNTFTGPTFISGGNLSLGGGTANQYGLGGGPGGNGNTTITISNATLTMFSDAGSYDTCYWNVIVPTNAAATIYADDRVNLYGTLTGGGTLNFNVYYVRTELDGNWSAFTGQLNLGTDSAGGDFRIGNSSGYANASVNLANYISAYHVTSGAAVSLGAVSGGALAKMSGTVWTVGAKNTDATFAGNISGNSITKVGTGAWTLTGSNYFTGTTTVSAGTLFVNGDNHSASGAVSVGASGTLGGSGVIGGATTVSGKLSPGSNAIGTLTFSNNVTLASSSTTFIEINRTAGTEDLVNASGTVTYGGTLLVTNLAGTPANGDSFKIFNAGTYGGTFANFNLPPLATGLAWDKSALGTSGTLSVIISNAVASGPKTLIWKGDGSTNTWDVNGTANWLDTGNAAAFFTNGDFVILNDTGSNNVPVTLNTTISPGSVSVNAVEDYVLSGSGAINGTNGLVKSGSGTFTLMTTNGYTGATTITDGTLRLLTLGSGLAHRWSFNNSLADAVGTNLAAIIDVGSSNVILSANSVTLSGGTRTNADYLSLGANLLPNTTNPVTIEIWATQNAVQNWARIFDFGASTTENLLMSWSQGTTLASDRVEWKDATTATTDNTCQPYTLGTEFHIALTIEPGAGTGGTTRVTWYRAASTNSTLGAARGTTNSANTLVSFVNTNCWLGRSEYTGDNTASASYNEVRIWNRALSAAELQTLHTNGPDAGLIAALPATTAVNLSGSTAVLDLQNDPAQTIGALAGAVGAEVRLTTAALTVGGNNAATTFAGFISGTNNFAKTGTGTLELSGANSFTGLTTLSNGTLLVNGSLAGPLNAKGGLLGGNGAIGGAATINYGATLAPGNPIGTMTFSNSLTLAAGCTNFFEINSSAATNAAVIVFGALTNGGTLIVTNIGGTSPTTADSFNLFTAASYRANFAKVILPALPFGLGWDTNGLATNGTLTVVALTKPTLGTLSLNGTNLTISGGGGIGSTTFYLLGATNLTAPLSSWTRLLTNQFDAGGNFTFTNPLDANWPQGFYQIEMP